MPQIINKLLGEQDIISDATITNKNTLLQTNQVRNIQLQSSNQDPHTHFVESGAKVDQSEIA